MESSFQVGEIRGIKIGIHYTWLIVFGFVTISLGYGFFPQAFPGMGLITTWIVAVVSSILLFASVLIHELAHSFVAQNEGIPVRGITLFIFGGVSNIAGEAKTPRSELYITGVGPASSLALGVLFAGLFFAFRSASEPLAAVLSYLGLVNFLLAGFNLIPGFPLDGGRLLRATIWALTKSFHKATTAATMVGLGVAYLFILAGIGFVFAGSFFSGMWLALIGWFLASAAQSNRRQAGVEQELQSVKVEELMNPQPVTVSAFTTIQQVVDDYVLPRQMRALPVVDDGKLVGLVTLAKINRIPQGQWPFALVRDAVTPVKDVNVVGPRSSAAEAYQLMSDQDLSQLPVVEDGKVLGTISRDQVARFVQVRNELKKAA